MNTIRDDLFYQEGYEAFFEGANKTDCPYSEGTDGEYGWLAGWQAGETIGGDGT